jgi:hypothetical protein
VDHSTVLFVSKGFGDASVDELGVGGAGCGGHQVRHAGEGVVEPDVVSHHDLVGCIFVHTKPLQASVGTLAVSEKNSNVCSRSEFAAALVRFN